LSGGQGVIVPAANQRNLVLSPEVVEAVESGLFAVYAVESVDHALEILTGMSAGTIDREGKYPADSLNAKAIQRLKEISDLALDDDKEEV
jgi:predicted ATP-dependent protease